MYRTLVVGVGMRVFIAIVLAACGDSASVPDGGFTDAISDGSVDGPSCGNGIKSSDEACDEGALNGTNQSSCTVDCAQVPASVPDVSTQVFPSEIETFVDLRPFRVAAVLSGSAGIIVASNLFPQNFDGRNVTGLQHIDITGEVTSLARMPVFSAEGSVEDDLLWIERTTDGQHLYRENLTTFIKTEIPYPFPNGDRGKLINNEAISPVIADIDRSSQSLLIAAISGQDTNSVKIDTSTLPSIGPNLGITIAAKTYVDLVDDPPGTTSAYHHRMLQFSADGKSFHTIAVLQYPDDAFAFQHGYTFALESGGTWPYVAIDGDMWIEGLAAAHPGDPSLSHPQAYAVLTNTGDIFIDQFTESIMPAGEELFPRFATLPGSPTMILTLDVTGYSTELWALESIGTEAVLWDGNNHDLHSSSLQPKVKKIFTGTSLRSAKTSENQSTRYLSRGNVLFYL